MSWKSFMAGTAMLATILVALGFFWPFHRHAEQLTLPGIVEIQEVRLGSKVGGRVADVLVSEGDLVQAGQVLVRFEAPELEAQRQQVVAKLQSMEAELLRAKNGPRPEEIRQAKSELDMAQADVEQTRQEFARSERLIHQGGTDRSEYDTARANRDRALGRLNSARARLDLLYAGTRAEEITDAEAKVAEMRGRLGELDANLREAVVRAPERALVEVLGVRKGDLVPPNQAIIRVLRADDLWVRVYVPETQLGKIRLGQSAQVTIDAYGDKSFEGTVVKIDSESEFTPRNVQSAEERRYQVFGVKVRVADPQGIFKSGMAAQVSFDIGP
jgi:multidrug resistance efflux pump